MQVVFATEITFLWASSLIKLSILSFYTRLSRDSMTSRYILTVRLSMAFIVVYLVTFTIVLCLTCRPFVSDLEREDVNKGNRNESKMKARREEEKKKKSQSTKDHERLICAFVNPTLVCILDSNLRIYPPQTPFHLRRRRRISPRKHRY